MKRACLLLVMSLIVIGFGRLAPAGNWVFLPSYYSHDPVEKVKVGPPQEFGGPYYTRPAGDYYRGSYRIQTYRLPNADGSYDTTYYYEGNRQIGGQY